MAGLPEWWGSRHPERMGNTTSSTFAWSPGPQRRLCAHRPPAAPPPRSGHRARLRRPPELPCGALPTADQPRTAGQRAWHHHRGCPPPARPRRPDPTTPPSNLRTPTPPHHRSAAGRPRGRTRLRVAGGLPGRPCPRAGVAEQPDRQRARRTCGHRARSARPPRAATQAGDRVARCGDRATAGAVGPPSQRRWCARDASVRARRRSRRVMSRGRRGPSPTNLDLS
jgi:hypothetical protein